MLDEVLVKMPKLKVLYMQNNEVCKGNKIPGYRKTIIAKIKSLTYLDDRPVFPEDRRHAEAYHRGGIEAEREERDIIRKEKDEKHHKNHVAFKEMMRKAREEKRSADEAKARAEAEARGETWEAPKPSEEKPKADEKPAEEEPQIYEVKDEEADQPPELEQVDMEQERELRAQQANNSEQEQKA